MNRRRLIGGVLIFSCAFTPVAQAQPTTITNGNIGAAVTAWVTNPTTAAATYGNIADWNTAAVTSMESLFYNKPTFNGDISKWNVASVSTMHAFTRETAFSASIGAWNTASVSNMAAVRAAFGPAARHLQSGSPMRACTTSAHVCARVCACGFGRPRIRAEYVRALSVGVDRVWLGSQAFYGASAFNANIGAWNTAGVTTLDLVCAAFGPRRLRSDICMVIYSIIDRVWCVCLPP
jgi:hypothetical protein